MSLFSKISAHEMTKKIAEKSSAHNKFMQMVIQDLNIH